MSAFLDFGRIAHQTGSARPTGARLWMWMLGKFSLKSRPLNPRLKNFSKESHYGLVGWAHHGSWCRNPKLDFVGRLYFCFVDVLHNCDGAIWRIRFQESEINSLKLISTANKSKKSKIKNQEIPEIQKKARFTKLGADTRPTKVRIRGRLRAQRQSCRCKAQCFLIPGRSGVRPGAHGCALSLSRSDQRRTAPALTRLLQ